MSGGSSFNQFFSQKSFYVKIPLIMMLTWSTPDTWFVVKSFEVVNFEFGPERKNIRLKFLLTTTCNTHHKKIFQLLVFLYYKKHEMYVVYCIPQLHIPSTEISQRMSNLD